MVIQNGSFSRRDQTDVGEHWVNKYVAGSNDFGVTVAVNAELHLSIVTPGRAPR